MPLKRLVPILLFSAASFAASPGYVKTVCTAQNYNNWVMSVTCTGTVTNAGDLLVAHIGNVTNGANTTAVTSVSEGTNNLTQAVNCIGSWNNQYGQWYGYAAASGSRTITVNWNVQQNPNNYSTLVVLEYSGVATSSVMDSGGSSHACIGDGVGINPLDIGGVTTSGAAETIVCGMTSGQDGAGTVTYTAGSGYGSLTQSVVNSSMDFQVGAEDRAAATATSYGTTISTTQLGGWAGGCVSYNGVSADYSITGPPSGYVHAASTNFTITNATYPKTITISDGGHAGKVAACSGTGTTPYAVVTSSSTCTFTYTPAVVGSLTLTSTITSGSDPTPNTYGYTSNVAQLSFSGCSSGNLRMASSSCTVTLTGGTFDGSHTVALSDGGNLGTFTSGGNSAQNTLTVTPTNGNSSFTFTYTPYLVGQKPISAASNTSAWANPAPFLYTSSSTDVCTFTAKASGNWSSASTWTPSGCTGGGHTTPGTGDAVLITGYHVTIPVSTAAYMGGCPANNTTYDLQISDNAGAASGWLEIAGKLWVCGNRSLTAGTHTLGGNPTTWPMLTVDTGGELDLDQNQNASVMYRTVSGAAEGWGKLYAGTLGDVCNFETGVCPTAIKAVNLGAVNSVLYDATSLEDTILLRVYGTLITDCGSSSKGCLESISNQNSAANAYADAGVVDLQGNIFLRTGAFQGTMTVVSTPTLINNRFLSDLMGATFYSNPVYPMAKTCTIKGNYFSIGMDYNDNDTFPNCDITGNLFHDIGFYCCFSVMAKSFTRNVALVGPVSAGDIYPANPMGNVIISTQNHMLFLQGGTNTTWTMTDNICFNPGSPAEDHCSTVNGPTTAATTVRMLRNLSIPAAGNGAESGSWMGFGPPGTDSPMLYFDHNGMFGIPYYTWGVFLTHSGPTFPDNTTLQSYRANEHWAPSASTMNIAVGNLDFADLASAPGNSTNTANLGWNGFYNAAASANFTTGLNNPNCNPSAYLGSPYDICEASKASPDNTAHDVTADPKVIDNTRNPYTWASRHSRASTQAGMEAALQVCQDETWCIEEMRTWIDRGFQPTNLALKGKAHDGSIVGFTGTYGSGYTGSCTVAFTPRDAADLGVGAAATCSFVGGVPVIRITNPGANYRIATPATVTIGGVCTGGCVAASLTPVISPHDIGPVQMALIPGAM